MIFLYLDPTLFGALGRRSPNRPYIFYCKLAKLRLVSLKVCTYDMEDYWYTFYTTFKRKNEYKEWGGGIKLNKEREITLKKGEKA